ncbi:MAG: hypothetical protein PVJ67_01905 [Candidatus Pacearchaeota archaeon]|jgi:hypothetical protein
MKTLQEEIYDTFQLWKKDLSNRDFYDLYVYLCIGDYPEQRKYYSVYWETLKKNSNDKKE